MTVFSTLNETEPTAFGPACISHENGTATQTSILTAFPKLPARFSPGVDAELARNSLGVRPDGFDGNAQPCGDLFVRCALAPKPGYLQFTSAERHERHRALFPVTRQIHHARSHDSIGAGRERFEYRITRGSAR